MAVVQRVKSCGWLVVEWAMVWVEASTFPKSVDPGSIQAGSPSTAAAAHVRVVPSHAVGVGLQYGLLMAAGHQQVLLYRWYWNFVLVPE